MVKHYILWQLKDEFSAEEKEAVKASIKEGLEGLAGTIPGMIEIKVRLDKLASCTADLMLDSTFEDEAALKRYLADPGHQAVASTRVRPNVKNRISMDFEC